jgi:hypothetical protein
VTIEEHGMTELAIDILAVPTAAAVLVTVLVGTVVDALIHSVRSRRAR